MFEAGSREMELPSSLKYQRQRRYITTIQSRLILHWRCCGAEKFHANGIRSLLDGSLKLVSSK